MEDSYNVFPTCWGPAMWFFLHSIACAYTPERDHKAYLDFFINLKYILPCEECREHYSSNLNIYDLRIALTSNESMFRFVYDLHNLVNKQTGVPSSKWPSYESVKKKYVSFRTKCSAVKGVCGSKEPSVPKMKIVEKFGNDMISYASCFFIIFILVVIIICLVSIKK